MITLFHAHNFRIYPEDRRLSEIMERSTVPSTCDMSSLKGVSREFHILEDENQ
jgi:hypothetical protein